MLWAVFMTGLARPLLLSGDAWDDLAKQPGDGEERRSKSKQDNYLKKDKTFGVQKTRSHVAGTTFHGSGTGLLQGLSRHCFAGEM